MGAGRRFERERGDGGGAANSWRAVAAAPTWLPRAAGALGRMQQGLPVLVEATSSSTHASPKVQKRRNGAGRVGWVHEAAGVLGCAGRAASSC